MSALFFEICGGITSPKGFVAGSAFCGIKAGNRKKHDMALIYSRGESHHRRRHFHHEQGEGRARAGLRRAHEDAVHPRDHRERRQRECLHRACGH